ncbi:unnamed protein product, partial [marine sediment metagenome]
LEQFAKDPDGQLIPWLMTDEAVEHPSEDLFESHVHSKHIAELITDRQLGRIGLIGAWGSGKTTVLNLVDHFLRKSPAFQKEYRKRWHKASRSLSWRQRLRPPRILTCRVQAWGFAKESAATVVLRQAVAELSKYMDCLSVLGLPQEYIAAAKGVAPGWVHGPLALTVAGTPSQQLKRLNPLLEAINARLVVYVEDLDRNLDAPDIAYTQNVRNTGTNVSTEIRNDFSARPSGQVFLQIESLLARMADAHRVSFVLAISR